MDIEELLHDKTRRFSKGQRRLLDYIEKNFDKAAFMTAASLGKTVGVSESTVVRFAVELGFEGYPEMRKALQEVVRNRLTSVQRIEVARELLNGEDLFRRVLNSDIEKLQNTLSEFDSGSFSAAVEAICSAKNIYVVGMRSSAALSSYFSFYMHLLRDGVHQIHDTDMSNVYEQLMRIEKGDLYIALSFPRYTSAALNAAGFAKERGASLLVLTDNPSSPFTELADTVLYAKSDMVSFVDSLVVPMSVLNALIVAVSAKNPQRLEENFQALEKIWNRYGVFFGNEG